MKENATAVRVPSGYPGDTSVFAIFILLFLIAIVSAVILSVRGLPAASAHPNTLVELDYNIQGSVQDMAISADGETYYLSGNFSYVGATTGPGVIVNATTGALAEYHKLGSGSVSARVVISDGSGGWYVGGTFTTVGNVSQDRLVHITSDGSINTSFDPTFDQFGSIYSLALDSAAGRLYVGGSFTEVNGQARDSLVALQTANGDLVDAFQIDVNNFGTVYDMEINSGTLYLAGNFSALGDLATRYSYGAIDVSSSTTSTVTSFGDSFGLGLYGTAYALEIYDGYVYLGGFFNGIGTGFDINHVARFDIVEGDIDSNWNIGPDSSVNDIEISDTGIVYVGGGFTGIGGDSSQGYLAAVDVATELSTGWSPVLNGSVEDIHIGSDTIYFAGSFDTVNSSTRYLGAAVDAATGLVNTDLTFTPNSGSTGYAIMEQSGEVYFLGSFDSIGGARCRGLVGITVDTGLPTSFCHSFTNMGSTAGPRTLLLEGNKLYVGGAFSSINDGSSSPNFAAVFNVDTNELLDIDFGLSIGFGMGDHGVYKFLIDGDDIYIGGKYTAIDLSSDYAVLGKFNKTTGAHDTSLSTGLLYPSCCGGNDGEVRDMVLIDDILYVGGYFTTATGSVSRSYLSAFNTTDGTLTAWAPEANGRVTQMEYNGTDTLYISGDFGTINGDTRNYLAAVDVTTGSTTDWAPTVAAAPSVLLIEDGYLYVGGGFSEINATAREMLASFQLSDETLTNWNPNLDDSISASQSSVHTLKKDNSTVFVGGNFLTAGSDRIFNVGKFGPLKVQFSSSTWTQSETVTNVPFTIAISSGNTSSLPIGVVLNVTGGSATYGVDYTVSTGTLTIAAGETSTSSAITIVNDDTFEADETIVLTLVSTDIAEFDLNTTYTYTIVNDEVVTPGVMITESDAGTAVTEGGATDSYTVVLNSQPDSDVTVAISESADLTISTSSIVFTAANWDTERTVTVTAVNDDIDEDVEIVTTTFSATSLDMDYEAIDIDPIDVTITDNDTAGMTLTQSDATTVLSEAVDGSSDSYTIVLDSEPTADVTVAITSDSTELTLSTSTIVFTSANWDTAITITATIVDDSNDEDATHTSVISHAVTSGDSDYNEFALGTVSVSITDDDTASITLTEAGGSSTVTEDGATDTYTLVLGSSPSSSVTIALALDNDDVTISTSSIVFTSANWSSAVTVTISAVNDATVEGDHTSEISHTVTSDDALYDAFDIDDVVVTITDNDVAASEDDDTPVDTGGAASPVASPSQVLNTLTTAPEFSQSIQTTFAVTPGNPTQINVGGASHTLSVELASTDEVTIIIQSDPVSVQLWKGESKDVDITGDYVPDVSVKYKGVLNGKPQIAVTDLVRQRKVFVINNDALQTEAREVTVQLLADGIRSLVLSDEPNLSKKSFESKTTSTLTWQLPEGNGKKTIYGRFILTNGSIIAFEDSINLVPKGTKVETCPLRSGAAYKVRNSGVVWFVTGSCTKRPFSSEDIFFSYFDSFRGVETIPQATLQAVPEDAFGAMPMGVRLRFADGSLVKLANDPTVYLVLQGEVRPIPNEQTFISLGFQWNWIETITKETFARYRMGAPLTSARLPYTLISYPRSSQIYRLEPDAAMPGKLVKRRIATTDALNRLGYRRDRVVVIPATEVYADGSPIGVN
ncbi:MAG: hypothetical protein KBD15_00775 [Candidatus Magasanikbacteria bacterium]|jgi:hypothetical protein|nr:hypothetical protein [Candidatus Magasanikbacteria bacterium]